MIPILCDKQFHGTGNDFRIGRLSSWIECAVTEARNGEFYLEGSLPVGGQNVDQLAIDRIILAAPSPKRSYYSPMQPFRICQISKPPDADQVNIVAHHVSYQLADKILKPDRRIYSQWWDSVQDLFNFTLNYVNGSDHSADYVVPPIAGAFNFESDITTEADVKCAHLEPMSVKAFLGDGEGSVLDIFGGEYDWDGWAVRLKAARGTVRDGIVVAYAKNMESLEFDTSTAEMVNGYYGYWKNESGGSVAYTDCVLYMVGYDNWAYPRMEPVDLSSELEPPSGDIVPTADQMRSALAAYATKQDAANLPTSITVTAVPELLQSVFLCDTIKVMHPGFGFAESAKIVQTVYDPIRERYTAITIGEIQKSITDTIARMLAGGF